MKRLGLLLLFGMFMVIACKRDKGTKIEATTSAEISQNESGLRFNVLSGESKVLWEGYKPTGTHRGTVDFKEGSLQVLNGNITGGQFILDMNSVDVIDLKGDDKVKLLTHLKGTTSGKEDDFFNVTQYPEATFEISKCIELKTGGDTNMMVYGNLTIKGVAKQIGFKARIDFADDRLTIYVPKFNIDRTQWGINFRSEKFSKLKDNFINDEIGLSMEVTALR